MREALGSVDRAWFRMDRPDNTADVVALLQLGAAPEFARLRALVAERLLPHDRFRQRVAQHGLVVRRDRWEDDPDFLLERHLRRRRVAPGERALRAAVDEAVNEPLEPARPLWRIDLLQGDGAAALVAKVHHCIADGFALVSVLLGLADDRPARGGADHALPAYRRAAAWLGPLRELAGGWTDPRRARALAADAAGFAAALARIAAQRADPPTPLTGRLTGVRRVAWSNGRPWPAVRAAARAHGVGANDLVVAAIAGALREELAGEGLALDGLSLRALVPVNLRPERPEACRELGNRFGLAYLDLPVDAAGAAERVQRAAAGMARAKGRPDALVTFAMLAAVGLLPGAVERAAVGYFARRASLVITSVPGPRRRLRLAGADVERLMFWVPHPASLGIGVSALTYAGELRVGVRADVAALPDPAALVERVEAELDRLSSPPASG